MSLHLVYNVYMFINSNVQETVWQITKMKMKMKMELLWV